MNLKKLTTIPKINYDNINNHSLSEYINYKVLFAGLYGFLQTEVRPPACVVPSTIYFGVRKRFIALLLMVLG